MITVSNGNSERKSLKTKIDREHIARNLEYNILFALIPYSIYILFNI